jgi:GNAT superfamily N-acetyltransferase
MRQPCLTTIMEQANEHEYNTGLRWPTGQEVDAYVAHTAQSRSYAFRASSLYEDYCPPLISHKLDLIVRCSDHQICGECGTDDWCENEMPIGRVVVNEFPKHMVEDYGDELLWLFDMFEQGPTGILGQMIDVLEDEGVIDLVPGSGAYLHVQNLEIREDLRRQGVGTRLLRYAVALLGRGDPDVVICELQPVACVYPALFPDKRRQDRVQWSEPGAIHEFLRAFGFSRWMAGGSDPRWTFPDLSDPSVPCYFKVISAEERISYING